MRISTNMRVFVIFVDRNRQGYYTQKHNAGSTQEMSESITLNKIAVENGLMIMIHKELPDQNEGESDSK